MGTAAGQAELRSLEQEVATRVEQDWSKLPSHLRQGAQRESECAWTVALFRIRPHQLRCCGAVSYVRAS